MVLTPLVLLWWSFCYGGRFCFLDLVFKEKKKKKTSLPYFGVAAEGLGVNSKMAKELMKLLPYLRFHLGTHCNVSSSHFLLYNMLDFCKCTPHVFVFLFSFFGCFHQLSFPIPAIWILEAMNNFSIV